MLTVVGVVGDVTVDPGQFPDARPSGRAYQAHQAEQQVHGRPHGESLTLAGYIHGRRAGSRAHSLSERHVRRCGFMAGGGGNNR